nr:MAG: hypothetical protein TU36_05505 [Vulcanisaeta sp. AZ3]
MELMNGDFVLRWGDAVIRIPRLKHGALFLMSGYIGSQIHGCEYRLHLDYMKGRIINKNIIHGLEEHAKQLGVNEEGIGLELGWNSILVNRGEEGIYFFNEKMKSWIGYADFSKPYVQEAALIMIRRDVPILGLPDLIINVNEKPTYIIELKTTNNLRNTMVISDRDLLQTESYFHMLNYLGFNPMRAAVIKMVRGTNFRVIKNIDLIIKYMESNNNLTTITKGVILHKVRIRDLNEFLRDVDYALDYWLGNRNPRPNPSRGLCSFCEHRISCPYSMVR